MGLRAQLAPPKGVVSTLLVVRSPRQLPATHAVVVAQPPSSIAAGTTFSIEVDAENANNNVDPTYNGLITVSLSSNPGSSGLAGTLTLPAVHGVATFTGLELFKPAAGYRLQVTAAGITSTTSNAFTVTGATNIPPKVIQVLVGGTAWADSFRSTLQAAGLGNGTGFEILTGSCADEIASVERHQSDSNCL